jgi:hypothetical protein
MGLYLLKHAELNSEMTSPAATPVMKTPISAEPTTATFDGGGSPNAEPIAPASSAANGGVTKMSGELALIELPF